MSAGITSLELDLEAQGPIENVRTVSDLLIHDVS